jgi:hypothetical protein
MVPSLSADDLHRLIDIAEASVVAGLEGRRAAAPDLGTLPRSLQRPAGAFVTLTVDGELNGCIGTIEGGEAVGVVVSRLAWDAAFADPRLPALTVADYEALVLEVSVLSPLEPLAAGTSRDLLGNLNPGVDGLLIEAHRRRAVFQPSVWRQLPDPVDFVARLQQKAGLDPHGWPAGMLAWRFTTVSAHRPAATARVG